MLIDNKTPHSVGTSQGLGTAQSVGISQGLGTAQSSGKAQSVETAQSVGTAQTVAGQTTNGGNTIKTLMDFIRKYTAGTKGYEGNMDIVTGFFTVGGLSLLAKELSDKNEYRLILGNFTKDSAEERRVKDKIINLLLGDNRAEATLGLTQQAQNALEFLRRQKVQVRAVNGGNCHAKTYIYKDRNDEQHDYYVIGSSNLTDAGLGTAPSANIELNMAETVSRTNATYRELEEWFDNQWKTPESPTKQTDRNDQKSKVDAKQYFIDLIEQMFLRQHTPEEIYYKILLELYWHDTDLTEDSAEEKKNMVLLRDSAIWNTLFDFQQQGVIALIKIMNRYNGAILADAVGLGKTFSALAVILYYQNKGYETVVLCPKKLEQNWEQYRRRRGSRFERDEFDYLVRFHSDLQKDRMEKKKDGGLSWLQKQKKLLLVIDESHNLRNDKSSRYNMLMDKLVKSQNDKDQRDVKILELSATPINNNLTDIRNQFKLIARGNNEAFVAQPICVPSLDDIFKKAKNAYTNWCKSTTKTIGELIHDLPNHFSDLTDQLVVARTRSTIQATFGDSGLDFPKKALPQNEHVGIDHLGALTTIDAIHDAMLAANLTAYKPSLYLPITPQNTKKFGEQADREKYLVVMMMVLFMKRLESSWLSCLNTMEKVLLAHETALATVTDYLIYGQNGTISVEGNDEEEEDEDFSIGKGHVQLAQMGARVYDYQRDLEQDIRALKYFMEQLRDFKKGFEAGTEKDEKLEKLKEILNEKAKKENKKVVIFTAYSDTANYLYEQLTKAGLRKIACVTGTESKADGKTTKDFTKILERFAPYSKLYLEQDWSTLYDEMGLDREMYYDAQKHRWNVDYETWKETIAAAAESEKDEMGCREQAKEAQETIAQEIDILIATDCLSEGQNLQDADTVVNYDIHWNPVRLIQRFGRIDRLKSPNKEIYMINLWPKQAMNDYIKIEERISHRMALMSIGGSETIKGTTSSYDTIMKDNPIAGKQVQKTLDSIAKGDKIEDIEDDSSTLSFATLSAYAFRQDLSLYLEKNKEQLLRMPNGVYSGFRLASCSNGTKEPTESDPKSKYSDTPESIVALVGTPHRDPEHAARPYERLYLMLQPIGQTSQFKTLKKEEILGLLSQYKTASREVPQKVEAMAPQEIALLKQCLQDALKEKCKEVGDQNTDNALDGVLTANKTDVTDKAFQLEDYDLIAWEYISAPEPEQTSKESEA